MSIGCMRDREVTIYRKTAVLFGPATVAGGGVVDAQPVAPTYVEVSQASDGTLADVDVVGLVGGVPDSETLTFTVAGRKRTCKKFESILGFATASTSTITLTAVGNDGSRIERSTAIASEVRAHKEWERGSWLMGAPGSVGAERTWYGIDYTTAFTPRRGDVILDATDAIQYEIKHVETLRGSGSLPHHWELTVHEVNGILP